MGLQFAAIPDANDDESENVNYDGSGAYEGVLHEVVDLWNDRPSFDIPSGFIPNEREATRINRRAQALFYSVPDEKGLWQHLSEEAQAAWLDQALKAVWDDGTLLFGPLCGDDPDGMDQDAVLDRVAADYLESVRAADGAGGAESK